MSPQSESVLIERGEGGVQMQSGRQKRLGKLRTDMHTLYDLSFQVLETLPTKELRKIANKRRGEYSAELEAEARSILHARIDPIDKDATQIEM